MAKRRQQKYNPKRVNIILDALKNMSSVKGACQAADISLYTFYEWEKRFPDFKEKVEIIRKDVEYNYVNVAKNNVYVALDEGNQKMTQWFLERRDSDNYARKDQLEQNVSYTPNINYIKPEDKKEE